VITKMALQWAAFPVEIRRHFRRLGWIVTKGFLLLGGLAVIAHDRIASLILGGTLLFILGVGFGCGLCFWLEASEAYPGRVEG
jgi:hypothetical protein